MLLATRPQVNRSVTVNPRLANRAVNPRLANRAVNQAFLQPALNYIQQTSPNWLFPLTELNNSSLLECFRDKGLYFYFANFSTIRNKTFSLSSAHVLVVTEVYEVTEI